MIEKFQKAPFEEIAAQCETKVSFWKMFYSIEDTSISINGDVLARGDLRYHVTAAVTSKEVQSFVFSCCLHYYQRWEIPVI